MTTQTGTRAEAVARACDGWVRRLYDLTRRNNLLYYRESRATLELTAANSDVLAALLAGESVTLARLLPAADPAKTAAAALGIRRRALENLEEKGLNTLYLAVGLATWTLDDDGRAPAAAVLLYPVTLERQGRDGRGFAVQRAGDPQLNLVLLHVLRSEFGCEVTSEALLADACGDDDILDPPVIFARVSEAARQVPGFAVTPRAVLGTFAFQKMAMVQDLLARRTELAGHDLIAALAGDDAARETIRTARRPIDPATLDSVSPEDEFLVFDADSSQQRVIAAALEGQPGVIQGPPGTGKSQTIANLIASLVARGRRVLFVAEKRAALDVVLNRLERAGLGRLTLDLHGADITRQKVMQRLADSLRQVRDAIPPDDDALHARFEERRARLNDHAARMNVPRPPAGMSVYGLLGRLLRLHAEAAMSARWRGQALAALDAAAAARVGELLTEAGGFGDLFLGCDPSPWTRADLPDGAAATRALDLVGSLLLERLPTLKTALASLPGVAPADVAALQNLATLLRDMADTVSRYDHALFSDAAGLAAVLEPAGRGALAEGWAWLTSGTYRIALRTLRTRRKAGAATPVVLLAEMRLAADQLVRWQAHSTAPQPPAESSAARQALEGFLADLAALAPLVPAQDLTAQPLEEVERRLSALSADSRTPHRISRLREIQRELAERGITPLLNELTAARPEPARWPVCFEYAWLASCIDDALAADPALGGFSGRTHEQFVEEFCRLDAERLRIAAARVRRAHAEHAVGVMNRFPEQEALVRREAEKRTRHLPLRALLAQAPDVLTALCPCWMASPLSVSQLLDADRRYFDVVIFDEASQVLPEDAVPALLRAGQAIVAGDKHQLPPTAFFTAGDADEEAEEAAPTEGFESLLDLLSAFVEPWPLAWHYRSQDEALIAFSNHYIYRDGLVTFPGVGRAVAMQHVRVDTAGEENTDSSTAEVRRVVDLVLEHARLRPHETLGVIALGLPHARRIEEALDRALDAHPELDGFFAEDQAERFFVKNLERVQGDERDAIILSIGYGKDKSGKLPYRFGPLLMQGGERRLNVAITRARKRYTLVSSFDEGDMDPARSSARGVELLRLYLAYAAGHGQLPAIEQAAASDDPFLADVARALEAEGIAVHTAWGSSRYRLECVTPHAAHPERLVLAIECDGSGYAAAPTARDRDRLRRQQLRALGWDYRRVWAMDWYLRREEEVVRLREAYQAAVARADVEETAPALPPPTPTAPLPAEPAPVAETRGPRPAIPRKESILDYTPRELVMLVRWLQSDGRLRTDEEILDVMIDELGFKRRGPRIEEALRAAIADWKRIEKMV